jgi:hypothetical protein
VLYPRSDGLLELLLGLELLLLLELLLELELELLLPPELLPDDPDFDLDISFPFESEQSF